MAGRGRPRIHPEGSKPHGIGFSDELWWAVKALAERENVGPSQLVRTATRDYIRAHAPDLFNRTDPESWTEEDWRSHARKHESSLKMPYDPKCRTCAIRYKDFNDFVQKTYRARTKPLDRDYIDPALKKIESDNVLSGNKYTEWTQEDIRIAEEHAANSGHLDKYGNLDVFEYGYERPNHPECPICRDILKATDQYQ